MPRCGPSGRLPINDKKKNASKEQRRSNVSNKEQRRSTRVKQFRDPEQRLVSFSRVEDSISRRRDHVEVGFRPPRAAGHQETRRGKHNGKRRTGAAPLDGPGNRDNGSLLFEVGELIFWRRIRLKVGYLLFPRGGPPRF